MYKKEIVYDRETRDYAMYLDGELIGFAGTYHAAEVALDQLVFTLLSCDDTTNSPSEECVQELYFLYARDSEAFYTILAGYTPAQRFLHAQAFAAYAATLGKPNHTTGAVLAQWARNLANRQREPKEAA